MKSERGEVAITLELILLFTILVVVLVHALDGRI